MQKALRAFGRRAIGYLRVQNVLGQRQAVPGSETRRRQMPQAGLRLFRLRSKDRLLGAVSTPGSLHKKDAARWQYATCAGHKALGRFPRQGTRVGSSRSVAPHVRSPMVIAALCCPAAAGGGALAERFLERIAVDRSKFRA